MQDWIHSAVEKTHTVLAFEFLIRLVSIYLEHWNKDRVASRMILHTS